MTNCRVLTQSATKRQTAAALAERKAQLGWSNGDAGDVLGCGEGTIRNRLDGDDPKNQMTVHELLRSIQGDDTHIANHIMALVDCAVVRTGKGAAPDALAAAGHSARCAAELIAAAPDGFDTKEARHLLPLVIQLIGELGGIETMLRDVIAGTSS
jgi:hypothetical protein